MKETSAYTSVGISKADPAWITEHWSDNKIQLVRHVADLIVATDPYAVVNHQALNSVLRNLTHGWMDMWIVYGIKDEQTVIRAMLLATKYAQSIIGPSAYHILGVTSFETIPRNDIFKLLIKIFEHAKLVGCWRVTANTDVDGVEKLAKITKARVSRRIEWELK
jgi:hypothetical protein